MLDEQSSKQRITIRLDSEIIEYYKQNHENYQSAINEALSRMIHTKSIQSLAQNYYSSLKKIRKNRFNEFTDLIFGDDIESSRISFEECADIFAIIKTIIPDLFIDIEELTNDFLKQDNFSELLFTVYMIKELGQIVAEDIGEQTYDLGGSIALGIAFLDTTLNDLVRYILNNFYVITDNDTLLEELQAWDEATEINSELLAPGSLQQSTEKINDEYLEYKVKINSIVNIYKYHEMNEKSRQKYNIANDYDNILSVIYTRIAYDSQNYGGGNIDEIPDFIIFKLIVSDLVKLLKSNDIALKEKLPEDLFIDVGFVWDISVFEIPTKATPILGLSDSGRFFNGDMDEAMNYIETYRPHLLELLEIIKDEETRDYIKTVLIQEE